MRIFLSLIFFTIFLLSVVDAAYYEGLREFYNRVDFAGDLKGYSIRSDEKDANKESSCVTTEIEDDNEKKGTKFTAVHIKENACNESTLFNTL